MEAYKRGLAVALQVVVSRGNAQLLMLEEEQAVKPKKKSTDENPGTGATSNAALTSTMLISPSPALAREDVGYKPAIGVRTDEEAFEISMALEQVLFVWVQEPAEKSEGPSAVMMERLSSDPDSPITR